MVLEKRKRHIIEEDDEEEERDEQKAASSEEYGGMLRIRQSVPHSTHSPLPSPPATKAEPKLSQRTLGELRGVIPSAEMLPGIPTTLYLGEGDVRRLGKLLEAAAEGCNIERMLVILRRLSQMPCTRPLLEKSLIGRVVGRFRKHSDTAVASLASRIVTVWKKQVSATSTPSASDSAPACVSPCRIWLPAHPFHDHFLELLFELLCTLLCAACRVEAISTM